jgi:hypothetical protein
VSWNEGPHSKLRGITELKPSELPEISGGASGAGQSGLGRSGREGSSIIIHEHSALVHCQQRRD